MTETPPTRPVAPRLSLITLGVTDLARSTAFYTALGWPLSSSSEPGVVSFFRTAGGLLALWGDRELAADAALPARTGDGFRGVSLAMNLDCPADVDAALATARAAGGTIVRPAQEVEWGGYTGYFTDPDGHLWEAAHNPFWPIGDDGVPRMP